MKLKKSGAKGEQEKINQKVVAENELKIAGLVEHHRSSFRSYTSVNPQPVREYSGKFGTGYTLLVNGWRGSRTQYSTRIYYIVNVENSKKV